MISKKSKKEIGDHQASLVNQVEIKLTKLARKASEKNYEKGIKTINDFLDKFTSDEILIKKAFFLYHYAAYLMYDKKKNLAKNYNVQKKFREAIKICQKIIKKGQNTNERNLLNSRIYLAQMYVMLGEDEKSKKVSKQTFKLYPSSLTAERIADIYVRLNGLENAIFWYEKSIELSKNPIEKSMAQTGLAVTFRKSGNSEKSLKLAQEATLTLNNCEQDENIIFIKKLLHSHFPKLDLKKPQII